LKEAPSTANDPELLKAQVRIEAVRVLRDQMPGILDTIRAEVFFQSLAYREDIYTHVWEVIQPIFNITESIYAQLHAGHRSVAVASN